MLITVLLVAVCQPLLKITMMMMMMMMMMFTTFLRFKIEAYYLRGNVARDYYIVCGDSPHIDPQKAK